MPDSHLVRSAVLLFFVLTLPFWEKRDKRKEKIVSRDYFLTRGSWESFLGDDWRTKGRWGGGINDGDC